LAQAPGIACGFALAAKRDRKNYKSFCILSDGEHYEGSLWESAMFASHYELDNLVFIVDRNKQIILGKSEDCLKIEPLKEKWKSFGWNVLKVIWGSYWDSLLAKDKTGLLIKRMGEAVDGEYQAFKAKGGKYVRDNFFGKYPELLNLVPIMNFLHE